MQKVLTRDGLKDKALNVLGRCIRFQEKYHPHPFSPYWNNVSSLSMIITSITYGVNNGFVEAEEVDEDHRELCELLIDYVSLLEADEKKRNEEFTHYGSLADLDAYEGLPCYPLDKAKKRVNELILNRRRF